MPNIKLTWREQFARARATAAQVAVICGRFLRSLFARR